MRELGGFIFSVGLSIFLGHKPAGIQSCTRKIPASGAALLSIRILSVDFVTSLFLVGVQFFCLLADYLYEFVNKL
jgi:hypothetical protein